MWTLKACKRSNLHTRKTFFSKCLHNSEKSSNFATENVRGYFCTFTPRAACYLRLRIIRKINVKTNSKQNCTFILSVVFGLLLLAVRCCYSAPPRGGGFLCLAVVVCLDTGRPNRYKTTTFSAPRFILHNIRNIPDILAEVV